MDDQQLEPISDGSNEFVIYTTEDGKTEVHLRVIDGTVWMTQAEMSELFAVTRSSISEHIKTIFNSDELQRNEVVRKFRKERGQGAQGRALDHYNLDAIMAVGYRVRGPRGTQFRQWATSVLKEYLIKGFVLDDEKLKDPRGKDYFSELLDRIRDIRSSEARLYLELRNIISLAADYDKKDSQNIRIFANIQDRLLAAVTGLTAAEIISTRSDPQAANMGLTSWKGKKVGKRDVRTAKNYLSDNEIRELNLLVSNFLEYAQLQAGVDALFTCKTGSTGRLVLSSSMTTKIFSIMDVSHELVPMNSLRSDTSSSTRDAKQKNSTHSRSTTSMSSQRLSKSSKLIEPG